MRRKTIPPEDIMIINIYTPNNRVPKFIKQKLIEFKGEIDNSAIKVGGFHTPLSITDKTTR